MRKFLGLLCALLLVAAVGGCSSSGGDETGEPKGAGGSTTSTTDAADDETTTTSEASDETTTTNSGDGSDGRTEEAYVSNLEQGFTAGRAEDSEFEIGSDAAACAAPRWVQIIGADTFAAHDIAPEDLADPSLDLSTLDLSTDQATQMIDAMADCGEDIPGQLRELMTAGLTQEQALCLTAQLDDDRLRSILIAGLSGEEPSDEVTSFLDSLETTCHLS